MNIPKTKNDLTSSPSFSSTVSTPYSGRSFSVGENQRPYKLSKVSCNRSESTRDSSFSSRPISKIGDQDLNNNIENKSGDEDDEDVGTIIANG
uniref:Uncharacterized protein n=1 Tax=Panagrolaimus superbus TaxID=310955 RepID=A0A914ZFK9_9BILA